jgi:hypothetical protein
MAQGTIFCAEHVPGVASAVPPQAETPVYSPYSAPSGTPVPDTGASPGLAFLLGLIPGVGAIYNGQYVKGLVHVVVLGVLISIVSAGAAGGMEPLFGLLIAVWVFYMAFEAHHTAKKRLLGQPVDEFSSIVPLRGRPSTFPVGPVVLIAVGILFLLNTLDLVRLSQLVKYWPIVLIVLGAYMLYERISPAGRTEPPSGTPVYTEPSHDRSRI